MTDYLRVMKNHADNLSQAGSPVGTRTIISQVLLGLDEEYNPMVATLQGYKNLSRAELQSELLIFEKRLDFQISLKTNSSYSSSVSVNFASNRSQSNVRQYQSSPNREFSQYSPNRQFGRFSGFRGNGGRYRGQGRLNNNTNNTTPFSQVCGKNGHSAVTYFHRFDKQFCSPVSSFNRGFSNQSFSRGGHYTAPSQHLKLLLLCNILTILLQIQSRLLIPAGMSIVEHLTMSHLISIM